jgi:hypothetical protein
LLFLHEPVCAACRAFLEAASDRLEEYQAENARLIAVFPGPVAALGNLSFLLDGDIECLSDPESSVRQDYLDLMASGLVGPEEVMLFALDIYGAPYVCLKGEEPEIPAQEDVLGWLRYISIQCPE